MSELTNVLNNILVRQIERNPEFESILLPGLSRQEILQITQDIPCQIPEELIQLYEWRNGMNRHAYENFIPCFEFESIEYAIDTNNRDCDNWLPIMNCDGNAHLIVMLGDNTDLSPIWCRDLELGVYEQCFDSLTKMFQTIEMCFDKNLYLWNETSEHLESLNYERYCQVHKENNPNSALMRNYYV
jgi:hypothetical protein